MKTVITIILLFPLTAFSQLGTYMSEANSNQIDSLRHVYKTTLNDTVFMETSRILGFYYHERNSDSAIIYQIQQLEMARKLGFKIWEADALGLCGFITRNMGLYPVSFNYFHESLRLTEDKKNEKNVWKPEILSKAGTAHAARLTVRAFSYIDMGGLYENSGINKELESYKSCMKIAEELKDSIMMSLVCGSIGSLFMDNNNLDSALYYSQLDLELTAKSGYFKYYGGSLGNMAIIYKNLGDYEKARAYFLKSILAARQYNNIRNLGNTCINYSKLLILTKDLDSSLYYTRQAFHISEKINAPSIKLNASKIMTQIFVKKDLIDSAFHYQNIAIALGEEIMSDDKIIHMQNLEFSEQLRINDLKEEQEKYQNKVRISGLIFGIVLILIVAIILYRNGRNRRKANNLLRKQREELKTTISELKTTQTQLVQSEKMASLGELTAGIAHEIQNPLNFVNNFSELNSELIDELKEEVGNGNLEDVSEIANDIKENEQKISHHGKRASAIVKGMLQHSRLSSGQKELSNINSLCDEYLRLSYHGLKAKDKSFNAKMESSFDENIGDISMVPQDIGRVILNLLTNAFYAVKEKQNMNIEGYEPLVTVTTKKVDNMAEIEVSDNGNGIPASVLEKIFNPFFTTKPTGEGTGLGLSLSYDIITTGHDGLLDVESKEGEGTVFKIKIPL